MKRIILASVLLISVSAMTQVEIHNASDLDYIDWEATSCDATGTDLGTSSVIVDLTAGELEVAGTFGIGVQQLHLTGTFDLSTMPITTMDDIHFLMTGYSTVQLLNSGSGIVIEYSVDGGAWNTLVTTEDYLGCGNIVDIYGDFTATGSINSSIFRIRIVVPFESIFTWQNIILTDPNSTAGIKDISSNMNIYSIDGFLNIESDEILSSVEVITTDGRLVYRSEGLNSTNASISINGSNIYFVRVVTKSGESFTKKIYVR